MNIQAKISIPTSFLITCGIFAYFLFNEWGVSYFTEHFNFWTMILPFIILFVVLEIILVFSLVAITNKIAYNKMTDDEKREYHEQRAQIKAQVYAELDAKAEAAALKADEVRARHMTLNSDPTPRCPRCGSTSITANQKGFGVGKAVVGAAVAGPLGLVLGNAGAKKVRITCLACGYQWIAGKR